MILICVLGPLFLSAQTGPWSDFQWKHRVLVVLNGNSLELKSQQAHWVSCEQGFEDRKIKILIYDTDDLEYHRLKPQKDFEVILIGLDGGIKWRTQNMTCNELFTRIDAMPMRQRELREK